MDSTPKTAPGNIFDEFFRHLFYVNGHPVDRPQVHLLVVKRQSAYTPTFAVAGAQNMLCITRRAWRPTGTILPL